MFDYNNNVRLGSIDMSAQLSGTSRASESEGFDGLIFSNEAQNNQGDKITFSPFNDIKEAKKYIKDTFGVKIVGDLDLNTANYIAESIVNLHNKGQELGVKKIYLKPLEDNVLGDFDIDSKKLYFNSDYIKNIDSTLEKTIDRMQKDLDVLEKNEEGGYKIKVDTPITPNVQALLDQFLANPDNLSTKQKIGLDNALYDILNSTVGSDKPISINEFHVFYHEIGHVQHTAKVGVDGVAVLGDPSVIKFSSPFVSSYQKRLFNEFKSKEATTVQVSTYATENPEDFVAEVYAGLLEGRKFSDNVMMMYRHYQGPEVNTNGDK